eukprot:752541-Hanusia_phi.AAC.6
MLRICLIACCVYVLQASVDSSLLQHLARLAALALSKQRRRTCSELVGRKDTPDLSIIHHYSNEHAQEHAATPARRHALGCRESQQRKQHASQNRGVC